MSEAQKIDGEIVTIAEAASRLGISQEAARKRIQRKRLGSVETQNGLMAVLPPDFLELERRALSRQSETGGEASGHDETAIVKAEDKAITQVLRRFEAQAGQIALLKAEVADLKEENKLLVRKNKRLEREVDKLSYGVGTGPD
jgi:hypothetical protein